MRYIDVATPSSALDIAAASNTQAIVFKCVDQFCMKLVDIAGHKIWIRNIGTINLMVILVIFLPLFVHKYM